MEPLASLNGLSQLFSPGAPVTLSREAGDAPSLRAPGKPRPVELHPDRVDGNEPTTNPQDPRPTTNAEARSGAGTKRSSGTPSDASAARKDPNAPSNSEAEPAPPGAGLPAWNQAVTYRIFPDLAMRFQSRVIDRETRETVREIPPDREIQLARAFQEHIGKLLDKRA